MNTLQILRGTRAAAVMAMTALVAGAFAADTPLPAQYREPFAESYPIRRDQHLQVKAYADRLLQAQSEQALAAIQPDYSSVEAYQRSLQPHRDRMKAFFGTPPPGAREGRVTKFQQVGEDAGCTVFRVWIEVVDGVDAYGI